MTARGVVAAGHAETCGAAAAILREGGNAIDAALAAMCVACVAEPVLASLGGGGYLITAMRGGRHAGETRVHDFFVDTPGCRPADADRLDFRPVHADFGVTTQEFHIGRASIAVPGAVKGLFAAHRDLGRMPMARVVEPAVTLARSGVVIDAVQAAIIEVVGAIVRASPAANALFASPRQADALIGEGERLRWPGFADVLEVLAIEGDDLFYRGEIAAAIAEDCRSGGLLTRADLARYDVVCRRPLAIDALGCRILLNPPPASGGLLLAFALALIDGTDLGRLRFGSAGYLRRLAEVMALTSEARLQSGFDDAEDETAAARLLDPQRLAIYRQRLLGRPMARRGTTHISVIDAEGNAAALTLTNGEGSACVVPGTDIMLNNMLGEDDLNPRGFHRWQPAVRMSSMMAPALVRQPNCTLAAIGSGGSNRIRSALLQVLVNRAVFGMSLPAAVEAPRLHLEGDKLSIEPGFGEGELAALLPAFTETELWERQSMFFGGVHAVERDASGGVAGAGDPRRGGTALIV